jgi:hypothetical protein
MYERKPPADSAALCAQLPTADQFHRTENTQLHILSSHNYAIRCSIAAISAGET